MSNYTTVSIPPQNPPAEVKPYEIVMPAQSAPEVQNPSPMAAAASWLRVMGNVPKQPGVI